MMQLLGYVSVSRGTSNGRFPCTSTKFPSAFTRIPIHISPTYPNTFSWALRRLSETVEDQVLGYNRTPSLFSQSSFAAIQLAGAPGIYHPSDTNLGTLAKMHGYACQDLGKILPRSYQGYHDHARSWQG